MSDPNEPPGNDKGDDGRPPDDPTDEELLTSYKSLAEELDQKDGKAPPSEPDNSDLTPDPGDEKAPSQQPEPVLQMTPNPGGDEQAWQTTEQTYVPPKSAVEDLVNNPPKENLTDVFNKARDRDI